MDFFFFYTSRSFQTSCTLAQCFLFSMFFRKNIKSRKKIIKKEKIYTTLTKFEFIIFTQSSFAFENIAFCKGNDISRIYSASPAKF